jgi:hypothetical protein
VIRATVDGRPYEATVPIGVTTYTLVPLEPVDGPDFLNSPYKSTATAKVQLQRNGVAYAATTEVTWSVVAADNSANLAVVTDYKTRATGLAWGDNAAGSPGTNLTVTTTSDTDGGNASINLTDIMGERKVYVQAKVTIDGTDYSLATPQEISFGAGPLSKFSIPDGVIQTEQWADASPLSSASSLPAAALCVNPPPESNVFQQWTGGNHTAETGLPSIEELQAVSGGSGHPGAYLAAGWSYSFYWTGEVVSALDAYYVDLAYGHANYGDVDDAGPVVCRR